MIQWLFLDANVTTNAEDNMETRTPQFILLEGIKHRNRFFTSNAPDKDQTRGNTGEVWYRVLGYADTAEEAQTKLYLGEH